MKLWLTPFLVLPLLSMPAKTLAHGVLTDYAATEDSKLEITVTFSSGDPFQQAPVQVYSPSDPTKPWAEGTTDAEGQFAFQPDTNVPGDWMVRIGQTDTDHADILKVPVTDEGFNVDLISQLAEDELHLHFGDRIALSDEGVSLVPGQQQPGLGDRLWMTGALTLTGSLGTTFLLLRRRNNSAQ